MRHFLVSAMLVALPAALLAPVGADAATKVSCNLITDPSGDTSSVAPGNDKELDIRGGDIAANARMLTVVIRLAALSDEDPTQPSGRAYEFDFSVGRVNFAAMGTLLLGGDTFDAYQMSGPPTPPGQSGGRSGTGIGQMTGVIDVQAREIRMSASISIFEKHADFGNSPMNKLAAFTYRATGQNTEAYSGRNANVGSGAGVVVDSAFSNKSIYLGWPSCVRIGS